MSALPEPADRGSYMSISSSLQQVAGGIASVVSGSIVSVAPGGELLHFDTLGYLLVVTTGITLTLMYLIDRKLRDERDDIAPAAAPVAVPE